MRSPPPLNFFDDTGWIDIPQVPHAHWQVAVANGDTRGGYMEFVVSELEAAGRAFRFKDPVLEIEVLAAAPELSSEVLARFPEKWWREEVAALDTRQGYAKWVVSQQEALDQSLVEQADQGLDLLPTPPRPSAP